LKKKTVDRRQNEERKNEIAKFWDIGIVEYRDGCTVQGSPK
jgi:hypothetical protein